jgi:hypothetical protein
VLSDELRIDALSKLLSQQDAASSHLAFLLKATGVALRAHPALLSGHDALVDIGVSTASGGRGVIRGVDFLSVAEIGSALAQIDANGGTDGNDDLAGAAFYVTETECVSAAVGLLGYKVCAGGFGRVRRRVTDGVAVGTVTWSGGDGVNGAELEALARDVRGYVETPASLIWKMR